MRPSTTLASRRYAPLGRCMYCLANGPGLSEEHLIPKALGGRWTLRDAVCAPCRIRTGRLEQATLDREFATPKTLLALKRRRARRNGPRSFPAVAAHDHGGGPVHVRIDLDAARYPRTFTLPVFAPATLPGGDGSTTAPIDYVTCRLELGTARGEITATATTLANPKAYGHSIAKWAYALAVAERGLDCCDLRPLRALLLGERSDVCAFVGNERPLPAPNLEALHSFELHERDGWLRVRLGLLGSAGMSPYDVVIGSVGAA